MFKKVILSLSLIFVLSGTVIAQPFSEDVKVPNAEQMTYSNVDANRLQENFNRAIATDYVILNEIQEMAKDFNATVTVHKDVRGYYFKVVYKNKKAKIIRLMIDVSTMVLGEVTPTNFIANKVNQILKAIFKVSKPKQLKKFNEHYQTIVNRLDTITHQELLSDVQKNPTNYGINGTVIESSEVEIQNPPNLIIKNSHVKIYR